MRLVIILLLYFFIFQPAIYGQNLKFRHCKVEDGLSKNIISAIIQDSKGFMWFAMTDGLNLFDGHTFKIFRHIPSDLTSLGNNSVTSIYENENNEPWVGTYRGIYLDNPITEKFRPFNSYTLCTFFKAVFFVIIWKLSRG